MDEYLKENPSAQYPPVIRKIKEIQDISNAEFELYKSVDADLDKIEKNACFDTADKSTIERYEERIGIEHTDTESLEFRRARLQNRMNLNKKYVMIFYCEKLNELIGAGNWQATINALRTEMTIESNAANAHWYRELIQTLEMIKPVRLQVIVRPTINDKVIVKHRSSRRYVNYDFIVGVSQLGDTIGTVYGSEESIGGRLMINPTELNEIAENIKNRVRKVIVNDTIEITNFTLKTVTDNQLTLEYVIPSTVDLITNIKLMGDVEHIASADVNITTADNVLIKHIFDIETQEGK